MQIQIQIQIQIQLELNIKIQKDERARDFPEASCIRLSEFFRLNHKYIYANRDTDTDTNTDNKI